MTKLKDTISRAVDVDIMQLDIVNHADVTVDLKELYLDIKIYENIFSNTMSGSISFYDRNNMVKNLPLIGKERIRIKFKTPSTKSILEKEFRVYKISLKERVPGKDDTIVVLDFVSAPFFLNASTRISKSYQKKRFSEIAQEVFQNYLQNKITNNSSVGKKPENYILNVVPSTEEKTTVVVPNWNVFQTMNWLCKKAEHMGNCDYVFFERWGEFYFGPLSKLKEQNFDFNTSLFFYTPNEINLGFSKMIHLEINRIMNYQELTLGESKFEMERSGAFSSTMITNDITYKNISYNKHSYVLDLIDESVSKLNKNPTNPITYLSSANPETKTMYRTKNSYAFDGVLEQYNPNNEQKRISQMMSNNSKIIHITVAGDTRRQLGSTAYVIIPSAEFLSANRTLNTKQDFDSTISGKYLISKIGHHIMKYDGYTMGIELMKDSSYLPTPDEVLVKNME